MNKKSYCIQSLLTLALLLTVSTTPLLAETVRTVDNGGLIEVTENGTLNDIDTSTEVQIGFPINFFNELRSTIFANSNGSITNQTFLDFDGRNDYSLSNGLKIISIFTTDFDAENNIMNHYDSSEKVWYGHATVNIGEGPEPLKPAFVLNWENVNIFQTNKRNTMQLLLIDRSDITPGDFDVELNYKKIEEDSNDISPAAYVGFGNGYSAPPTQNSWKLNGSNSPNQFIDNGPKALLDTKSEDQSEYGRILLESRNGIITPPTINYKEGIGGGDDDGGDEEIKNVTVSITANGIATSHDVSTHPIQNTNLIIEFDTYTPNPGDEFPILKNLSSPLTCYGLSLPSLPDGYAWNLYDLYVTGKISVLMALPGLEAWFDPSDPGSLILNNNKVKQWLDKTGNHIASQNTEIAQPSLDMDHENYLPYIEFNGGNELEIDSQAITGTQDRSIVIIYTSDNSTGPLLSLTDTNGPDGSRYTITAHPSIDFGSTAQFKAKPRSNFRHMMIVSNKANSTIKESQIRLNGNKHRLKTEINNDTLVNTSSGKMHIGFSEGNYYNGNISQIMIFNRMLNAQEIHMLSYLGSKRYKIPISNQQFPLMMW